MASSIRVAILAALASPVAALAIGCSPPGAVNERAVLESTPHSEPASYAKTPEDYNKHMMDRLKKGGSESLGRVRKGRPKGKSPGKKTATP